MNTLGDFPSTLTFVLPSNSIHQGQVHDRECTKVTHLMERFGGAWACLVMLAGSEAVNKGCERRIDVIR